MKRVPVLILALPLLVPALAAAQAPSAKFGVIDVERVVSESAAGKEAFLKLKKLQEKKVEEAKQYEKSLLDLQKQMEDQKFVLSEQKMKDLQKLAEDRQIAYKRFKDDTERELKDARDEELKKLEDKIFPIINQMGKEMGFALIFNKFNSGLVYADESVDVTDEILKRFNSQVNLPAPKTDKK
jgi:outer membrane protein